MPTDPFVAPTIEDEPRQEPNLAPGVQMPPARAWRANRPGDLTGGQPRGELFGSPGPNIGYALTLAERLRDRLSIAPHEHTEDALAVIGELAMKRAASYGRAPVMADLEAAALLLGYLGDAAADFVEWRVPVARDAAHDYPRRRAFCDAVDLDLLRLAPQALVGRLDEARPALRARVESELAG